MLLHIRNVVVVVVVRRLKPKSVLISNLRTMAVVDSLLLKSKFRGCLLGGLLGDCLGAPFEGDPLSLGANKVIQNYFDKLEEPDVKGKQELQDRFFYFPLDATINFLIFS